MYMVVSYDIEDDKRRGRIHRILKSFGQWMQYSVFECDLTRAQYLVLRHRLDDYIKLTPYGRTRALARCTSWSRCCILDTPAWACRRYIPREIWPHRQRHQ